MFSTCTIRWFIIDFPRVVNDTWLALSTAPLWYYAQYSWFLCMAWLFRVRQSGGRVFSTPITIISLMSCVQGVCSPCYDCFFVVSTHVSATWTIVVSIFLVGWSENFGDGKCFDDFIMLFSPWLFLKYW